VSAELQVLFVQVAPARAIEAVDDLGQSLALPEGRETPHKTFTQHGGKAQYRTILPLSYPDRPGSRIARLKGAIPVLLEAREPVPALVIPLADAEGRVVSHDGVTIEVARVSLGDSTTS